jgi:type II secretory pathway pseudopilin PulG
MIEDRRLTINDEQQVISGLMPMANDQQPRTKDRGSERGYILLMLMLFVTLLAIAAAAVAPSIAFRVRRDREEEMIHRGVQYSRAIRTYVKKTGRYPSRLEDLENTNNIRFLRKRYKDPITGKDFKLLHVGEVQMMGAAGIAGAAAIGGSVVPGASPLGGATTGGGPGAAASMLLGGNQNAGSARAGTSSTTAAAGDATGQDATQANPASGDQSAGQSSDQSSNQSSKSQGDSAGGDKLSSTVFGGGPIVGVASTSKAQSIREFNHKNHYNQWQFVYDPTMDRGGLITTPAQPPLQVAAPLQQQNSSSPGQNSSSFGTSGPGMTGNGMSGNGSGFSGGTQSPPPSQPSPQQ